MTRKSEKSVTKTGISAHEVLAGLVPAAVTQSVQSEFESGSVGAQPDQLDLPGALWRRCSC